MDMNNIMKYEYYSCECNEKSAINYRILLKREYKVANDLISTIGSH